MPYASHVEIVDIVTGGSSVTIPGGVSEVDIWAIGAGGSGSSGSKPAGGGAGGFAYKRYSVLPGEWETTLTVSVGVAASGYAGGDSYVQGTLNGVSITTLEGKGGGKAGSLGAGGTGGSAYGGSTNATGADGQDYDSENDIPGLGGVLSDPEVEGFVSAAAFCSGGNGDPTTAFAGGDGVIIFWWRA